MAPKRRGKGHDRRGQPLKLTHERIGTICSAIADGMSHEGAALAAGVTSRTLFNWRQRSETIAELVESGATAIEELNGDEAVLYNFFLARARVESQLERDLLKSALTGDKHELYGATWILEKRWRDRWGREPKAELQRTAHEARTAKVEADTRPARSEAEIRKLEAEATAAEAKARLADQQSKSLAHGLTVDLTGDDGGGIVGDVTADDVAQVTPTDIGSERE